MVIIFDGKPRRVRQWFKNHIYRMYNFRILREQGTTLDSQGQKKLLHFQKKVDQHINYGLSLGIPADEIKNFNLAIIAEVKKRKNPTAIIQELIRENGQK